MIRLSFIFLGILTLGCASGVVAQDKPATERKPAAPSAPDKKPAGKQTAVITMEKGGEIRIEFYAADAPKTVENFVKLANDRFYDGTTFHRVEPAFVIQGGDPTSKTLPPGHPDLGKGDPGYKIKAEFNKQKHDRGAVAMARSQHPDSAGSQFYICYGNTPHLDGSYTVFGKVTSGMEHVDRIKQGDKMKTVAIVEE
jgi:peptidylprolyl isomerase/peptidyl-prolyl cis-trans isomerase B (cyclophilin B)